jgi:hypothetical protein
MEKKKTTWTERDAYSSVSKIQKEGKFRRKEGGDEERGA